MENALKNNAGPVKSNHEHRSECSNESNHPHTQSMDIYWVGIGLKVQSPNAYVFENKPSNGQ